MVFGIGGKRFLFNIKIRKNERKRNPESKKGK